MPRLGLSENFDYVYLTPGGWQLLQQWYGGGPCFERQVTAGTAWIASPLFRQVIRRGSELQIELMPQLLRAALADPSGQIGEHRSLMFSRSDTIKAVYQKLLREFGLAQAPGQVQVWISAANAALAEWQKIDTSGTTEFQTLDDQQLPDNSQVVMEKKVLGKPDTEQWPFMRQVRLQKGRQSWKDPNIDKLQLGDRLDAKSSGEPPLVQPKWYPATVVMEETDRVLLTLSGAAVKQPPHAPLIKEGLAQDAERQLSEAATRCFSAWFDQYADEGKMSRAGLARWVEKAAKSRCPQDDARITRTFTALGRDAEGFLRVEDFCQFFLSELLFRGEPPEAVWCRGLQDDGGREQFMEECEKHGLEARPQTPRRII